jgi:hypothetical protein
VRGLSWIVGCILVGRLAHADGGADADRLFEEGREFAKAGQYTEACERFAQSLAIERTVGTELNLGDCHEQLGQLRDAWEQYTSAASDAEAAHDDRRVAFAHDRIRSLEAKMTTLVVRVADPERAGLTLTLDGRRLVPRTELREHVAPGPLDIEEAAPGSRPVHRRELGSAGVTLVIELPALAASEQLAAAPSIVPTTGTRDDTRTRISYGLGAVAAGSAVTALALTLVARDHYATTTHGASCSSTPAGLTCNDAGTRAVHDAQHLADLGTAFAITSAVFLASAAVVYVTAPHARIYVRPRASLQGAGLVLGGSF